MSELFCHCDELKDIIDATNFITSVKNGETVIDNTPDVIQSNEDKNGNNN